MGAWTALFERDTVALVQKLVDTGDQQTWRALMVRIAPRLEGWARKNRLLRRCRLAGEDDARAVMVAVLERLAHDGYENLRGFLAHASPAAIPGGDADLVADVLRLAKLDDDGAAEGDADDEAEGTPFRAWLLRLVDFTTRDHVRRRLGWGGKEGAPSKRDLHSDAAPLDDAPELGARPPMTDRLTVSKLLEEVSQAIEKFPTDMRTAVVLWLDDVSPEEIARRLSLADGAKAKALIRAGQARLRERFRGRSPVLFA